MGFRKAQQADLTAIEVLLNAANLPYEDCYKHLSQFLVYEEDALIVGVGGVEIYDDVALLRSIVIDPKHRGQGLGQAIFLGLKGSILNSSVQSLYLLTNSADDYFKNLGFIPVIRDKVPLVIQQTEQFSSLCPDSATVMTLSLK